mmetsp:Transcript_1809/g.2869  ORF Transcript_1809/g.2869 Transcript_1809/m.2869 type:complete len:147 (-) Transcript_1809:181-621(-)
MLSRGAACARLGGLTAVRSGAGVARRGGYWNFRSFGSMGDAAGPVQTAIEAKLKTAMAPVEHLEVMNESYMHNVPKGSETHFKVVVVSEKFQGLALLARHRAVNEALQEEIDGGVHALSIVAKTPEQWAKRPVVTPSPNCRGGSKN